MIQGAGNGALFFIPFTMSEDAKEPDLKINQGEQLWQRSTFGRPRKYETPEALIKACEEYFIWSDENPLQEVKLSQGKKHVLPKMRPYTLGALQIFIGVDDNTWQRYRKEDPYKDFWAIVAEVDKVIYNQKFTGAACDFFNPAIIARDLGLTDKTDITSNGKTIGDKAKPVEIKMPDGSIISLD